MGEHKRNKRAKSSYKYKRTKSAVTALIIIVLAGAAVYFDFQNRTDNSILVAPDPQRFKGDPEAPLQILEFIDFQCRECRRGNDVLREYMFKYPLGIALTVKYFPLGELNSTISAVYAQCAANQNNFWAFYDEILNRQDEWRSLLNVEHVFKIMARDVGLDQDDLKNCVVDKDVKTRILKEQLLGESYGVRITPTYFINDEMIVGVDALESALKGFFEEETDIYMID